MPHRERDRLLARIAEIRQALRHAASEDVRATLRDALDDCERRLAELDRRSTEPATVAGPTS
jgi:hypothetical protein